MEMTITLPESVTVGGKGFERAYDMRTLSPVIVAQLAAHGLRQKAVDGASGVPATLAGESWVAAQVAKGMESAKAEKGWKDMSADAKRAIVAKWSGDSDNFPAILEAKAAMRDKTLTTLEAGEWSTRVATESHGVDVDVLRTFIGLRAKQGNPFTFAKGTPTAAREFAVAEAYLALPEEKRAAIMAHVEKARADLAALASLA